jgi:hypothetical protein
MRDISSKVLLGGLATIEPQLKVTIPRKVEVSMHRFTDFFKGFENVAAVKEVFGEDTEKVLKSLMVEFAGIRGYMGVNESDGHLIIGARYLNEGRMIDIYLDVIHELVHVKQFLDGRELFDSDYSYVERPTEVEAYRHAVKEAKRLGMNDDRICEYLKTEWMSDDDLQRLAKTVGVKLKTHFEKE